MVVAVDARRERALLRRIDTDFARGLVRGLFRRP
jgi:hypothetical protein